MAGATKMQQRRGTAAEWAAANPVLDDGEIGFDLDNKILKVGDGVTAWDDLQMAWLPISGGALSGALLLVDGSAADPALALDNDPDTGLYGDGADTLRVATGGVGRARFGNLNLVPLLAPYDLGSASFPFTRVYIGDGSVASPALLFGSDPDTGLARTAEDVLRFISGGVSRFRIQAGSSPGLVMETGQTLYAVDGTALLPGIAFGTDTDVGLARLTANELSLVAGGVVRAIFAGSGIWDQVRHFFIDGTAAAPGLGFSVDQDTGFYRAANDEISVTLGGVQKYVFDAAKFWPRVDNSVSNGGSGFRWTSIWAVTGTIQTSDEELKRDVRQTSLGKDFVSRIQPIEFKFEDGARPHQGFSAQQVKETLTELGVEDSAAFVDPSINAQLELDAGPPAHILEIDDEKDRGEQAAQWLAGVQAALNAPLGLRYSEMVPPLYRAFQQQQEEIDELRNVITELRTRIEVLERR